MRFFYVLVVLLSCNAIAKQSVVDITSSVLSAENMKEALGEYYSPDKVDLFQSVIIENGPIIRSKCKQNHDSDLFDTVACYVSYRIYLAVWFGSFIIFKKRKNGLEQIWALSRPFHLNIVWVK